MPMHLLSAVLILLCVWSSPTVAEQAAAPLWSLLRDGSHVALLRHAATAGGAGDPPGFRLEDCATQRNLTDKGRADARQLGQRFRAEKIAVAKLLSSQWCRCRETAALLDLGAFELAPTFNNAFTFRERVAELTAGAREIVAAWNGPGTLVVVTHGANIMPLTGIRPGEGEIVVVSADRASPTRLNVLGVIKRAD